MHSQPCAHLGSALSLLPRRVTSFITPRSVLTLFASFSRSSCVTRSSGICFSLAWRDLRRCLTCTAAQPLCGSELACLLTRQPPVFVYSIYVRVSQILFLFSTLCGSLWLASFYSFQLSSACRLSSSCVFAFIFPSFRLFFLILSLFQLLGFKSMRLALASIFFYKGIHIYLQKIKVIYKYTMIRH